jgi:hypothetical protein
MLSNSDHYRDVQHAHPVQAPVLVDSTKVQRQYHAPDEYQLEPSRSIVAGRTAHDARASLAHKDPGITA